MSVPSLTIAAALASGVVCVLLCTAAGPSSAQTVPAPPIRSGAQILRSSCETCHSLRKNEIKLAPSLYGALNGPKPRHTRAEVVEIVEHGVRLMPAYGNVLTPDEVARISDALENLAP